MKQLPRLLLHSCCGPCSTAVIERLAPNYALTVFFYNPNLTDPGEYKKRLRTQQQFIEAWNRRPEAADNPVQLIEGVYAPNQFFKTVRGLETEPEGGNRCRECFRMRLEETAEQAARGGYDWFTTTLSVSPHKNWLDICEAAAPATIHGVPFLVDDFKKQDGYRRSVELSAEYGLYRQKYCGCAFSQSVQENRPIDRRTIRRKNPMTRNLILPTGYHSTLDLMETQRAIKKIKDFFQQELAYGLELRRVSAPLVVDPDKGLNDNLSGVERTVSFTVRDLDEKRAEVPQSLAKWKRLALGRYGIEPGRGIYTDMNALRRDEELDNLHSIYVDQWDWEKTIRREDRTEEYLRETVITIYNAIKNLGDYVNRLYREIKTELPNEIYFITSQELADRYPGLPPKERENAICREEKAVFLLKIGGKLRSGERHDGRAPDYDDWELNGDILLWNEVLECAFEISSMGIRVDEVGLPKQLAEVGALERLKLEFHRAIIDGTLPYSIGGGIGQSRLCMFFLRKAHIGEVQSSLWADEMVAECLSKGIEIL